MKKTILIFLIFANFIFTNQILPLTFEDKKDLFPKEETIILANRKFNLKTTEETFIKVDEKNKKETKVTIGENIILFSQGGNYDLDEFLNKDNFFNRYNYLIEKDSYSKLKVTPFFYKYKNNYHYRFLQLEGRLLHIHFTKIHFEIYVDNNLSIEGTAFIKNRKNLDLIYNFIASIK